MESLKNYKNLLLLLPYSFSLNNQEFKDYWTNIKLIFEWHDLDKDGNSFIYLNKFNNQKSIYICRLIEKPWKCYVGNAKSFSKR
jgi:hypothetical protein